MSCFLCGIHVNIRHFGKCRIDYGRMCSYESDSLVSDDYPFPFDIVLHEMYYFKINKLNKRFEFIQGPKWLPILLLC